MEGAGDPAGHPAPPNLGRRGGRARGAPVWPWPWPWPAGGREEEDEEDEEEEDQEDEEDEEDEEDPS